MFNQQVYELNFPIANASHHEVRRGQNYCSLTEATTKMMALVFEEKAKKKPSNETKEVNIVPLYHDQMILSPFKNG